MPKPPRRSRKLRAAGAVSGPVIDGPKPPGKAVVVIPDSERKRFAGRPVDYEVPPDAETIARTMGELGCPTIEVAIALGMPVTTVENQFGDLIEKGVQTLRQKLRQSQIRLALGRPAYIEAYEVKMPDGTKRIDTVVHPAIEPNPTMNIWLGKQKKLLAQSDSFQLEGGDKPIQHEMIVRHVVVGANSKDDEQAA